MVRVVPSLSKQVRYIILKSPTNLYPGQKFTIIKVGDEVNSIRYVNEYEWTALIENIQFQGKALIQQRNLLLLWNFDTATAEKHIAHNERYYSTMLVFFMRKFIPCRIDVLTS